MYSEIILQLIREFQRDFPRKLQESVGMLKVTKGILNVHFRSPVKWIDWGVTNLRNYGPRNLWNLPEPAEPAEPNKNHLF